MRLIEDAPRIPLGRPISGTSTYSVYNSNFSVVFAVSNETVIFCPSQNDTGSRNTKHYTKFEGEKKIER